MLYWGILFFFAALSFMFHKILWFQGVNKKVSRRFVYIVIVSIILVLFSGLRGLKVGCDTGLYYSLYCLAKDTDSFSFGLVSEARNGVEIGFFALEYLFSRFFSFQVFLIFTSALSILPIMLVIYKYSKNFWLSLFFYISFGYYSFAMGGIRQSIAIGFCMFMFHYSQQRKLGYYLFNFILACSFHVSAVLFFPIYFLTLFKPTKKIFFLFFIVFLIVVLFRDSIFLFINQYSRQSFPEFENQGGLRMFIFMLSSALLGWYYLGSLKKDKTFSLNWSLLLIVSVPVLMWPIANINGELNRMYYYYHIFILLFFPNLIYVMRRKEQLIFCSFFCLIGCYYLHAYIINGELLYSPYYFFFE